ncbi:adenosylmethionine--8-amino-7-oxononanoate transaminase [Helicobacter brantae]|nr:adenosylmethionine--8-amino-7-oxononanoate transaminase [Helicobacter brantae]
MQKYISSPIWHPCTQHKDHEMLPPILIKSGKGVYLYDSEDRAYIDCISSWWVNLFGHSHPYINSKLQEQAQKLEHVILAGFSHTGIVQYSQRLLQVLNHQFDKCFYADNGSSAIEVALKMSFHKHLILGEKREKFLTLSNSYHGETLGALSVGDVGLYKDTYSPLLFQTLTTPTPYSEDLIPQALEALRGILQKEGANISAFILEPLLQCAGGMKIYSPLYIQEACRLCKDYGIDIIFDEIAVGFGRVGSLFAFEQCGVIPDFLCLSKGITAGYLPLSVVVTHNKIFEVFYDDYESQKAFLHSHSYTGNALAIACANATLDIFENENILEGNKLKREFILSHLQSLREFEIVENIRSLGMIFAFDLCNLPYKRAGFEFYKHALKEGLLLRPLGNTIYFMPPYIINEEEISLVFEGIKRVLTRL